MIIDYHFSNQHGIIQADRKLTDILKQLDLKERMIRDLRDELKGEKVRYRQLEMLGSSSSDRSPPQSDDITEV